MAGKVAKPAYSYKIGPRTEEYRFEPKLKVFGNMDTNDYYEQLSDSSIKKRAEVIEELRRETQTNGGKLPVRDPKPVFRGLGIALNDSDWNVRHQCIKFIHELIPHFGDGLDECMDIVLPTLIPNMGDPRITVRKTVIQLVHVYLKHSLHLSRIFQAIIDYGIENKTARIQKEVIIALPLIFTPEFANEDFSKITVSLAKKLVEPENEDNIQQHALLSLHKINKLVGDATFNSYLQKLSPNLRRIFFELSGKSAPQDTPRQQQPFSINHSNSVGSRLNNLAGFTPGDSLAVAPIAPPVNNYVNPSVARVHIPSSHRYEFGIIPSHIVDQLRTQSDFRSRAQAAEELKILFQDISNADAARLNPHIAEFLLFIDTLLDDSNFKITTNAMEVVVLLVHQQGESMRPHVKSLINLLTKRMSDNKSVIRAAIMKIFLQLMQHLSVKLVVNQLSDNLTSRHSKARQETLNIFIAALLTFPSYEFDLSELCQMIGHTLIDSKRHVRQAALECFAAIASSLGPGKMQPLVTTVDSVELNHDGDGAMAAVQARLARRVLPRLSHDGLVEYATPVPSSATSRNSSAHNNNAGQADIDWIMCGSSINGSSARSTRSEDLYVESLASSARSTPAPPQFDSHPQSGGRRFMSAGKGKGRLPWENGEQEGNQQPFSSPPSKFPHKHQTPHSAPATMNESSENQGSYRQIYLQSKKQGLTMAGGGDADDETDPLKSPIPTRPTLARNSANRSSKRKVPPIPQEDRKTYRQDPAASSKQEGRGGWSQETGDDDLEMEHGLMQIRSSATRKKVDKIFEVLDKQHQRTQRSPSPAEDSGVGTMSAPQSQRSGESWSKASRKTDGGASDKSRVRKPSTGATSQPRFGDSNQLSSKASESRSNMTQGKNMPHFMNAGGVTFKENPNLELEMRGQGYADDNRPTRQPKDRYRPVGKGLPDSSVSNVSSDHNIYTTSEPRNRRSSRTSATEAQPESLTGVYGVGVWNSHASHEEGLTVDDEDYYVPGGMSETLRAKVDRQKALKKEEAERVRSEREAAKKEKERERFRQLDAGLSVSGSSSQPGSTTQNGTLPRSKAKSVRDKQNSGKSFGTEDKLSNGSATSQKSGSDPEPMEFLQTVKDPHRAVEEALHKMGSSEWDVKCLGIGLIRRLAYHQPEALCSDKLHAVCLALMTEVKNLRSQVSRLAIVCIGEMFLHLKRNMDSEVEKMSLSLLIKYGGDSSNAFMREDVETALSHMIEQVTPQRSLFGLINGGATHKNPAVRRTASHFVAKLCERLGPNKVLSGAKDMTERILPAACQFMLEGQPEPRYNGQKIMWQLMQSDEFDRALKKYVSSSVLSKVSDKLEQLRSKGLGDPPSSVSSAKSRGMHRNSSVGRNLSAAAGPARPSVRTDEATMDTMQSFCGQMKAQDWRERYEGIQSLMDFVGSRPAVAGQNIVKIFDSYVPCLQDSNSKVNLFALQAMCEIAPQLSDYMGTVLTFTVKAIAGNLASKNPDIHNTAKEVLDIFTDHLDKSLLVQPFCSQAMNGSPRIRPDMIERVAYLVCEVYPHKPKQITLHVLPLLWNLLGRPSGQGGGGAGPQATAPAAVTGPMRNAAVALVRSLYEMYGDELMSTAKTTSTVTPSMLNLLSELLSL